MLLRARVVAVTPSSFIFSSIFTQKKIKKLHLLRGHESQLEEQAEIIKAKYRKYTGYTQALCSVTCNMYMMWGRNHMQQ